MATTLKVGGVEHAIPEMNFIAVERAWPYVELAMETVHPIAGTNAAIAVIAATLMEDEQFDASKWGIDPNITEDLEEWKGKGDDTRKAQTWPKDGNKIHAELINVLRKKLKANEIGMVKVVMFEVLKDAGFELGEPGSGEDPAAVETASPSPETAHDILQSSSLLDAREAAGTA